MPGSIAKWRRQQGDTIVEVMIVLAVLGLALGISYATANRSLMLARQAQENSEATNIVASQIEALRFLAPQVSTGPVGSGVNIFYNTDDLNPLFCVKADNASLGHLTGTNPNDYSAYPVDCQQSRYYIAVAYCDGRGSQPMSMCGSGPSRLDNDTFTVQVTWDNVQSQGQDTVTQNYRIHKN